MANSFYGLRSLARMWNQLAENQIEREQLARQREEDERLRRQEQLQAIQNLQYVAGLIRENPYAPYNQALLNSTLERLKQLGVTGFPSPESVTLPTPPALTTAAAATAAPAATPTPSALAAAPLPPPAVMGKLSRPVAEIFSKGKSTEAAATTATTQPPINDFTLLARVGRDPVPLMSVSGMPRGMAAPQEFNFKRQL